MRPICRLTTLAHTRQRPKGALRAGRMPQAAARRSAPIGAAPLFHICGSPLGHQVDVSVVEIEYKIKIK